MKRHHAIIKVEDEKGEIRFTIDYRLIRTPREDYDIVSGTDIFSVLILQSEMGITTNYEFVYDVARDEENAVAILNALVYNKVMPCNAGDVLADIL